MSPDVIVTTGEAPLVGAQNGDFVLWFLAIFEWIDAAMPGIVVFTKNLIGVLIGLSIPLSVAFLIVTIYSVEQLKRIRKKEEQIFDLKVEPAYEDTEAVNAGDPTLSKRWDTVSLHINSDNPNDWKQAIIEADIMLDDVLTKLGYRGDSIGDKLKRAEPADFSTLNEAWEAHKVRNQIAHSGSTYPLNQHEANRVIQMYRKVFEEFYYL